ncbi:hypothetical protein PG988_012866 [Apiospora saccharicola]
MAVMKSLRRTCKRMIREIMEGLSLVKYTRCKAVIDSTRCCRTPVDPWKMPYCEAHAKQERALYYFYKLTESTLYDHVNMDDLENPESKGRGLNNKCEDHEAHERVVIDDRAKLQKSLWTMGFAINTRVPEHDLREIMRNILVNITITQPLDVLRGISGGTREEYELVTEEAAMTIWNCLHGLEVIKLLDRGMATEAQLMDENFEYQSEEDIFRPSHTTQIPPVEPRSTGWFEFNLRTIFGSRTLKVSALASGANRLGIGFLDKID